MKRLNHSTYMEHHGTKVSWTFCFCVGSPKKAHEQHTTRGEVSSPSVDHSVVDEWTARPKHGQLVSERDSSRTQVFHNLGKCKLEMFHVKLVMSSLHLPR